ncbi:MAG: helix-turn-helix transcriptional regulator [Clostridiaceae bacterium]
MLNYHLIGKRIKEMRKMRKITQSKLAELTNLSVSYVNYIENGKRKTSLQTLVMIADVMEITVDILLAGNQSYSRGEYKNDIFLLMEDCSNYEKRIIYEQIQSLKTSLRHNSGLLSAQASFTFGNKEAFTS